MSQYTALVQRLGAQRSFAALGRRLAPLDRRLYRLTHGRWSVIGRHGLPSLLITTTGRKSGLPRTQPLLYATDGDGYVVVGSNWGQAHHPAWSSNLLAQPTARVTLGDREFDVHAPDHRRRARPTLAAGTADLARLRRIRQARRGPTDPNLPADAQKLTTANALRPVRGAVSGVRVRRAECPLGGR